MTNENNGILAKGQAATLVKDTSKSEVDRYSRMRLPGLDLEKLQASKVFVIGAGGVGAPLLLYLVGAGIRDISIADGDTVSLTNLHRQILYREGEEGQSKAELAAKTLGNLNSEVKLTTYGEFTTEDEILESLGLKESQGDKSSSAQIPDLVIECTDNAKSMRRVHDICLKHKLPLMLLSAEGTDFAVMYYDFKNPEFLKRHGCLGCLGYTPLVSRAFPGILGPAAGMAGVYAAGEVIKLLAGAKSKLYGHMVYYRNGELAYYELSADDDCKVHGTLA